MILAERRLPPPPQLNGFFFFFSSFFFRISPVSRVFLPLDACPNFCMITKVNYVFLFPTVRRPFLRAEARGVFPCGLNHFWLGFPFLYASWVVLWQCFPIVVPLRASPLPRSAPRVSHVSQFWTFSNLVLAFFSAAPTNHRRVGAFFTVIRFFFFFFVFLFDFTGPDPYFFAPCRSGQPITLILSDSFFSLFPPPPRLLNFPRVGPAGSESFVTGLFFLLLLIFPSSSRHFFFYSG